MILAAAASMILALVFGLIMVVHDAATQVWRADGTGRDSAVTDRHQSAWPVSRDVIAAEPMLEVQPADSRPTSEDRVRPEELGRRPTRGRSQAHRTAAAYILCSGPHRLAC
jgi:hypothetical protein